MSQAPHFWAVFPLFVCEFASSCLRWSSPSCSYLIINIKSNQLIFSALCLETAFGSVQFSHSVMSNFLQLYGMQHARPLHHQLLELTQTHVHWFHPIISSSVIPFSSHLKSFPASGSFPMSQFFKSGGQSIGASASVLPVNFQYWFLLELTGLISLQSKGLSWVFSNPTFEKNQFFSAQLSIWSNSYIRTWLLKKPQL